MTTVEMTPEVQEETVQEVQTPPKKTRKSREWDWTTWSESHESLAKFVVDKSGVQITPAQVKAVLFMRKSWADHPDTVADRQRRKEEKRRRREEHVNETADQRKARLAAARKVKSLQQQEAKLKAMKDEIQTLRVQAGLDPEPGSPVAQPEV